MVVIVVMSMTGCGKKTVGGGGSPGDFKAGATHVPVMNQAAVKTGNGYLLDTSDAANGVIIAQTTAAQQMVCQVTKRGRTYNYWFDDAHKTLVMPLSEGAGTYRLKFMQNTGGNRFVDVGDETVTAHFRYDKAPFIAANSVVNFNENSPCVATAASLAKQAKSDLDLTAKVVAYVEKHLTYDQALADSNPAFYFPDLDKTLATGKGICFDYAALTAAMLRSQGVPTKVYVGYIQVDGKQIYHAWDMVYIKNKGWITVKMAAEDHHWNRVDTTMDDTTDLSKIGADAYTRRYIY